MGQPLEAWAIWDRRTPLAKDQVNLMYWYTSREAAERAIAEHADDPNEWVLIQLDRE